MLERFPGLIEADGVAIVLYGYGRYQGNIER